MNIIPDADIQFHNVPLVVSQFKSFINFMNNQFQKYEDNVFLRYHTMDNGKAVFKMLTYSEVDLISTNLACQWSKYVNGVSTVGFVADHSVGYCISMLALLKLRVTMLCISPRNSETAIINLLQKTGCQLIITGDKYEKVIKKCISEIPGVDYTLLPTFDIEALTKNSLHPDASRIIDKSFSDDDITKPALIIHSSGSTNLPKPIYISNEYLFCQIRPFYQLINTRKDLQPLGSNDVFLCCAPLFHLFAFASVFSMAIVGGSSVFLERLPASQDEINFALYHNKSTLMCATPIILEQMANHLKKTNDFTHVSTLKYVFFGGANLKVELGQWLHEHKINVGNIYGNTEAGTLMGSDLNPKSKNWTALTPFVYDERGDSYCVFETDDEAHPEIKHLYIRGDSPTLAKNTANRSDGGFDTNDLFIEDSRFPGYYNYVGRRDDLIVLKNGQKINPIPMEDIIRQHPIVNQVVVVGKERHCTSVLISLNVEYAMTFNPSEMINEVYKAVKEANTFCPNYGIILQEMIEIIPLNKQLPVTAKGNVMRKKAEMEYKGTLDKLYQSFLEGSTPSTPTSFSSSPSLESISRSWTSEETKDILVKSISKVFDTPISILNDNDKSLFDMGLNSLTSIQLRNSISKHFDHVTQNFIFQYPTINSMCEALIENSPVNNLEQKSRSYEQTRKITEEYLNRARTDFQIAKNEYSKSRPKVILLTGCTGSLGAFILRDLLNDSTIQKVYVAVRGEKEEAYSRLFNSIKARCLDTCILQNSDRVEVLPVNFKDLFMGFGEERYNQLKEEVTIVQHCAWHVDFNKPVDYFEKECIAPFYNLLKFAYKDINPMHVHFISSVSASAAGADTEVDEKPLPFTPEIAIPIGYAQSKFVVEVLLDYLHTQKNFPCYIERLGQICGDSTNGVWNIHEQYPLMLIGGGSIMHEMPNLDMLVNWIPVDYASTSIVSIMNHTSDLSSNTTQYIFHIVNPQNVAWEEMLNIMKTCGLKFDTLSPKNWVKSLSENEHNPAYRLYSFYENELSDPFKWPAWKTEKTKEIAPILKNTPVLDSNLFSKFLTYWSSVGFYDSSN